MKRTSAGCPEHLVLPPAGDLLGPALPFEDAALGVGDDDGVVGGVAEEELEPLVALADGRLGPLAVGQVDPLGEDARDRAVGVAEGLVDELDVPLLERPAGLAAGP